MYCFTLHQYQALYVAVSLFHMSGNAVALHAHLRWTMWGLTVQELTQTYDVTMKDEYMYLSQRGGGAERGEGEEREGGGERERDLFAERQTYIICREREREIYLPRSNPLEKLN